MKLSFHGAAREVTGSCHLLQANKKKILIDCGLFQGYHGISRQNESSFGFKPSEIDAVILTHAHLDHCGRLPLLYKGGFRGEVISTGPSEELASLVMYDSAFLMEEEATRRSRHGNEVEPLYNEDDVTRVINRFNMKRPPVAYNQPIDIAEGITATFIDSGHILGSGSIKVVLREGPTEKTIIFSGDIGNKNKPIVRDPISPPESDFVVMESTYGNRNHKQIEASLTELYPAINETFENGGNVFMPTFAVEGSQEMLFFLREGYENGLISKDTKTFLDSPMAISATDIFRKYPDFYNGQAKQLIESGIDPFMLPNLTFSRTPAQSKSINEITSGAIVMAGSGMCEGGRILHHLKQNLSRPECTFIFTRYAPSGTLARKIINGSQYVKIFGSDTEVRARILTINGFSGHAGRDELLKWVHPGSPKVFLTHGSEGPMESLAEGLTGRKHEVEMPEMHEQYRY